MSSSVNLVSSPAREILVCPECNARYLHQQGISVFRKEGGENSEEAALRVTKDGSVTSTMDDNPSYRRDGIIIDFWCEGCPESDDTHRLAIYQHKGQEMLRWVGEN